MGEAREKAMSTCSLLACLMVFIQDAHARADMGAQIRHGMDSQDIGWVYEPRRPPLVRIRGPYWSRGFALYRTTTQGIWLTPGSPMPVLGHTVGASVSVDF